MSPNKLATYNRQKCIQLLEKITKNLFRMFRDPDTTKEQLVERFSSLKKQLDALGDVVLTGEYHREMRIYIELLAEALSTSIDLEIIRGPNMTKLNRLQKIKNKSGYKRKQKSRGNDIDF